MNKLINYLKCYLTYFIILIIYLIIISILYYFELFNYKTITTINLISSIIMFYLLGHRIARLEHNRGYYNGFLISVILVIIFTLITLITNKITLSSLIYYLILIISSILGGIIGVTKK